MNIRGTDPTALAAVTDLFVAPVRDGGAQDFQRVLSPPKTSEPAICTAPPRDAPRETKPEETEAPERSQADGEQIEREKEEAPVATEAGEATEQPVVAAEEAVAESEAEVPVEEETSGKGDEATAALAVAATLVVEQQLPEQKVPQVNPEGEMEAIVAVKESAKEGEVAGVVKVQTAIEPMLADRAKEQPLTHETFVTAETAPEVAGEQVAVAAIETPDNLILAQHEQAAETNLTAALQQTPATNSAPRATPVRTSTAKVATGHERAKQSKGAVDAATSGQTQETTSTVAHSEIVTGPATTVEEKPQRKTKQTEQLASAATSVPAVQPSVDPITAVERKTESAAPPAEVPAVSELHASQQTASDTAKLTTTQPLSNQAITQRLPGHALLRTAPQQQSPPPLHADAARFLQRVTKAFEAAHERGGEIRLRLSPPELGALRVEVNMSEQGLAARVEVETNDARTILLENLGALRDRLAEQGLRLEKFDVDLSQREPQQQDRNDFPEQQRDQQSAREARSVRIPNNPTQPVPTNSITSPTSGWQDRQLNVIV